MRLEEEVQKLTAVFVDNLMIKGEETEDLKESLGKWLYTIRSWSKGGHSRQELHKENTELQYVTYAERNKAAKEIEKKVYLNDPCPCGSGKKYKKCCGRK